MIDDVTHVVSINDFVMTCCKYGGMYSFRYTTCDMYVGNITNNEVHVNITYSAISTRQLIYWQFAVNLFCNG